MYDKKHLDDLLVKQHIQKWTQRPKITIKNDPVRVKTHTQNELVTCCYLYSLKIIFLHLTL